MENEEWKRDEPTTSLRQLIDRIIIKKSDVIRFNMRQEQRQEERWLICGSTNGADGNEKIVKWWKREEQKKKKKKNQSISFPLPVASSFRWGA